jgi:UDP-glucose 4-epimerase
MGDAARYKVLVTGAAGFMGRHVAAECQRLGMEVVGLDDLSGGFLSNVPEGVRFVKGSVNDDSLIRYLTESEGFDFIYHLAAYAAEGLSHFIRRFNYTNNVTGSVTLINAALRTDVRCFVFTSSIAVYGSNQVPMTEDLTPQPEDPYGVAKYAVELDLRVAHEMFGLPYVIFRPHNVYGEYQNIADRYRNVVGIFMNQTLRGEPMTIFGDGLQTRAFSYIRDVAPVIARSPLVAKSHNQVFNIGADRPCTALELAHEVARAFGVEPRIVHLDPRNEVKHAYSSHEKVREVFPELPESTPLAEGIPPMAEWVKSVGARKPIEFDDIEVHRNLPPSWAKASNSE